MPFNHFQHAPPKNWDHFEELCADLFQEEWGDKELVRHGRGGQAQYGVDIYGSCEGQWPVGIQCKGKNIWPVKSVSCSELDAEVEKAKTFVPPLKSFYLVSTSPEDQALQKHARKITDEHKKLDLFAVNVLGWSELLRRIGSHPKIMKKHFGGMSTGQLHPLIASWSSSGTTLNLSDDELKISIQEMVLSFRENPNSRIEFRKEETASVIHKLREIEAQQSNDLIIRKEKLDLRKELLSHKDNENKVIEGLYLLLKHKTVSNYVQYVWEEDSSTVVRSFVEQQIDRRLAIIDSKKQSRMKVRPPNNIINMNIDHISVYMPKELCNYVFNQVIESNNPTIKFDLIPVWFICKPVSYEYIIPAIIRRIIYTMSEGAPIEDFEKAGWLEVESWKCEIA